MANIRILIKKTTTLDNLEIDETTTPNNPTMSRDPPSLSQNDGPNDHTGNDE
jgi:hypothetical protein